MGTLYEALPGPVKAFFLGVSVLAQAQIGLPGLVYLLGRATLPTAAAAPDEAAARTGLFREAYRALTTALPGPESAPPFPSPLRPGPHSGPEGGSWVEHVVRIAAVVELIVERREGQLRRRTEEAMREIYRQAHAEQTELARAAQTTEWKAMITEAVEEVSARHEQATSHLVKSLTTMVGEWSPEKLFDAVEALLKERVNPLRGDLQQLIEFSETLGERLGQINVHLPAIKKDLLEVRAQIESLIQNSGSALFSEDPSSSESLPQKTEQVVQELARVLQDIKSMMAQWDVSAPEMSNAATHSQHESTSQITKILDTVDKIHNQMKSGDTESVENSNKYSTLISDDEVVEAVTQIKQLNVPLLLERFENALARVHTTPTLAESSARDLDTINVVTSKNDKLNDGDSPLSSEVGTPSTPLEVDRIAKDVFRQLKDYLIKSEVQRTVRQRNVLARIQRQQRNRLQREKSE
ncbi:unnamed protein product [Phytomonas sp. Hart1]|nr:unnamed protein product [Phytomonas sp. Hart1]|eukprot:CCW71896.1 unnamed protein product [Phytomonas sp. isolate Hart1]